MEQHTTDDQPVIIPRWEWRTFGSHFGRAEQAFAAMTPTGVQESDELYLISEGNANVKVRFDLLDVKVLVEVNRDGLEQWRPIMKARFPTGRDDIERIFEAVGGPLPDLARDSYTLDQFVAELAPAAGLQPVQVHKRRVRYVVGGCTSEVTDVVADGHATRTIAIESEDAAAVVSAVESVGLADYLNTSYGKGLSATIAGSLPAYAVIDVGTNSVKFHLAQRQQDGTWRRLVDRAEVCRLGEGIDDGGSISAEALARTVAAISGMVTEARRQGALAISGVGTAVFRIATNGADAVAAIRAGAGLQIEVLSGDEESRLAYLAARASVEVGDGAVVVFDTGGGSSQFTYGSGATVDDRFSLNVGAARYTERFALDQAIDSDTLDEALSAISSDLAVLNERPRPDAVVGMGGGITNMTAVSQEMASYDPDAIQGSTLTTAEVDRQIELYRMRSADERRTIVGLQPKRAEVILAGACIVRTILAKLGAQALTVSDRGLRHGVLLERFGLPAPAQPEVTR
jgi:exopolyphosphatase / guanosine-5'-triphosphate,3'-diphosphate pyrophosphatase